MSESAFGLFMFQNFHYNLHLQAPLRHYNVNYLNWLSLRWLTRADLHNSNIMQQQQ